MDYRALRQQAVDYFLRKNAHGWLGSGYEEDFAQFVCLGVFQNRTSTLRQFYVDFLRSYFGDQRKEPGMVKSNRRLQRYESKDPDEIPQRTESFVEFDEALSQLRLEKMQRCCLVLYHLWEFELNEIGHCLGVSESRVCQMLSGVKRLNTRR